MLSEAIERLILRRVELHLPGQPVLLLLRHGVTSLHAQFTLRHGKVLELFAVLGFLEQFLAFGIIELDASALLLDDSLHVLRLDSHLVIVFTDRVTALGCSFSTTAFTFFVLTVTSSSSSLIV